MKKMYLRVEKAGQLISYKTGSSMVTECVEAKLLYLTIKLLSNRVELSEQDEMMVLEIGSKVAHCSTSFNYTSELFNFLSFIWELTLNRFQTISLLSSTLLLLELKLSQLELIFAQIMSRA